MVRFLLDAHLGRLASYLRMLGVDAEFPNEFDDDALLRSAAEQGRILLTRDRELLRRSPPQLSYGIIHDRPREQLAEVVRRFELGPVAEPFSRCLRCNRPLARVSPQLLQGLVPADVLLRHEAFRSCAGCGRIYWAGSHYERMARLLAEAAGVLVEPTPQ